MRRFLRRLVMGIALGCAMFAISLLVQAMLAA